MKKDALQGRINAIRDTKPVSLPPPVKRPMKPVTPRASERKKAYKFGSLILQQNMKIECVVQDYSAHGAKIKMNGMMHMPPELVISIPELGIMRRAHVVWQEEELVGLSFGEYSN